MEITFTVLGGEGGLIIRKALPPGPPPRRFVVIAGGGKKTKELRPKLRVIHGGRTW